MDKQQGIILKNYSPHQQKCCVLDRTLGKVFGITRDQKVINRLRAGSIVAYQNSTNNKMIELCNVDIMHMPLELARNDIYFIHQMLELCYFFLPEVCAVPSIFDLLFFLLNSVDRVQYSYNKNMIVVRFFIYLGIYPQDEVLEKSIQLLLEQPLDTCASYINQQDNEAIDQWIRWCIVTHPLRHHFKTLGQGALI